MPRKRPAKPIRHVYSRDLKRHVIYQAKVLGKPSTQIAIDLDMDLRVVQCVKQTWREIGDVCRDRKYKGRPPLMSSVAIDFMLALLEHSPDLYLDEIQDELLRMHDLEVSLPTICRTLKRLGFSSKKLSKAAAERCKESRQQFRMEIGAESPESLVMADESAVNILTTYRLNGWAFTGMRAHKSCKFVRGTRYSLLPAITIDGIIYSHIKVGGYNGEEFLEYLDGLTAQMNPYPGPRSVLVIDNCRIHHVLGVEELCAARGIKLIYLPPYSPDYNPIEECFSFIKAYIRRHGHTFRNIVETGDNVAPFHFLYEALDQVTAAASRGWFHDSGYI